MCRGLKGPNTERQGLDAATAPDFFPADVTQRQKIVFKKSDYYYYYFLNARKSSSKNCLIMTPKK